jgi:hypothetical protein
VTGYGLECDWPSAERHPPCTHLYAFFGPLVREAAAAPPAREAGTE